MLRPYRRGEIFRKMLPTLQEGGAADPLLDGENFLGALKLSCTKAGSKSEGNSQNYSSEHVVATGSKMLLHVD
jgi:hypothetical protein